ncbi:MAG: NAD(+)/NADH kinase [Lachnospiraceae bacterium]|nr:NAD(+)/NADH kinase [Lachnospiraceae bacterium]
MDRFYVITNEEKDKDMHVAGQIAAYLKRRGIACGVQKLSQRAMRIPLDIQCIIVLGGDGTLLQVAREVVDTGIPLFGVNMGTLGYLAEVDRRGIFPALDKLLQDEYEVEKRMMLQGTVYHGDQVTGRGIALNDIVIGREGPLRVICLRNYVNGEYLNEYKADGIIVATPTGSTGYSLSAGGPIVAPKARMTVITPLAPHTLNSRSIILPGDDVITVEIGEGRHQAPEEAMATFDGDISVSMVTGDRIVIEKAQASVGIIKMSNLSFVEVMRRKMSGQ